MIQGGGGPRMMNFGVSGSIQKEQQIQRSEGQESMAASGTEGDAEDGAFRGPRSPNPWHLTGGAGMLPIDDGRSPEHLHRSHVVRLHFASF